MMKSTYLLALVVLALLFFEQCSAPSNYQPDKPAQHTITLEVVDEQPAAAALDSLVVLVKERLEKIGCAYNGVQLDANKRQLKIGVVELPDRKGILKADRLQYLEMYLSTTGKLEFCEFWDKKDPELKVLNSEIMKIFQYLDEDFFFRPGKPYGAGDSAQIYSLVARLDNEAVKSALPPGAKWAVLEEGKLSGNSGACFLYLRKNTIEWFGNHCISEASFSVNGGMFPNVMITLKPEYHANWASLTRELATNNQSELGILIDDRVVSAPKVMTTITQGQFGISGMDSYEQLLAVSDLLSLKPYPVSVRLLQ